MVRVRITDRLGLGLVLGLRLELWLGLVLCLGLRLVLGFKGQELRVRGRIRISVSVRFWF